MPKIVKLVTDVNASGVAEGVREFAECADIPLEDCGGKYDAALLVVPRKQLGWSLANALVPINEAGKPYWVTDGVRFSQVEEWLDTLADEFDELNLKVIGPPATASTKAKHLGNLTMKRLLVSDPSKSK